MNKLCKPILLKCDKNSYIGFYNGKLYFSEFGYKTDGWINRKLVLISLDPNEKIRVGDLALDLGEDMRVKFNAFLVTIETLNYARQECKKVIATQEQLPLEYIKQYIKEYNENKVNNIGIVMECFDEVKDMLEFNEMWHNNIDYRPKPTNGFLTIAKKEDYETISIGEEVVKLPIQELKKPITYTEKEVLALCIEKDKEFWYEYHNEPFNEDNLKNSIEWFYNNKKK